MITTAPAPGDYRVRVKQHRLRVSIRGIGAPVLLMNGLGGSVSLWEGLHLIQAPNGSAKPRIFRGGVSNL
jgi:hypothetical protein